MELCSSFSRTGKRAEEAKLVFMAHSFKCLNLRINSSAVKTIEYHYQKKHEKPFSENVVISEIKERASLSSLQRRLVYIAPYIYTLRLSVSQLLSNLIWIFV